MIAEMTDDDELALNRHTEATMLLMQLVDDGWPLRILAPHDAIERADFQTTALRKGG